MKRKTLIIVRIVISVSLVLLFAGKFGVKYIEKAKRMNELSQMYCYEVYSSYVWVRESYYVYLMCNPEYTVSDIIDHVLDEEYFLSLKSEIDSEEIPPVPAKIFMMIPTEDLPYGWEKDELNISHNFDKSIFHRHTQCTITIPYGATSLSDCEINYEY